jgi:UDP-N-acetylmuramyl tripeptide synthase
MEILQTKVMRGPNYWSAYRNQLIVIKIALQDTDLLPQESLPLLGKELEALKPPLHCLKSYDTILDVVAQIAIEIQCLAGMDCVYARVHTTANPNNRIISFSYTVERAGIYAAKAAVSLVNALINRQPYHLEKDIHNLKRIQERFALDATTQGIVDEALARNIPVIRLDKKSIQLGYGSKQQLLHVGESNASIKEGTDRIPIVAVTGTNGKTTTTRLIAYLARCAGYNVGFTTTDGIYIQNDLISVGDCSGPLSAGVVLKDPDVNFAVLECARGGILRAGLAFDQCQVSVVTNISGDHLGMDDIETLDELARVKFTVAKTTSPDGYAILNADDDLVYGMKQHLACNIALFSLNPANPRIIDHCKQGNLAAFTENGYFTICHKRKKIKIANIKQVPLTHDGKSMCMIQNVLPALLTAYIFKRSTEDIQIDMKKFQPTPENTPGRMNVFNFDNFTLMIDYAHNEAGYKELKKYTDQIQATVKVGIIAAVADRPDEDIVKLGRLAAGIFNEIIIRHDAYNNGRSLEEINQLLQIGIRQVRPTPAIRIISNEFEAIKYAIEHAKKGAWIFVNSENVYDTIFYVSNYKTTSTQRSAPQVLQRRGVF